MYSIATSLPVSTVSIRILVRLLHNIEAHICPALSAALDLYFAVYPAVVFHRLTCSRRRKFTLSIMLGLGVT